MNFYPLLLALSVVFVLIALWKSGLMGYPILAGIGIVLLLRLGHYSKLWVRGCMQHSIIDPLLE